MARTQLAKISRHLRYLGKISDHNPKRLRRQTDYHMLFWHRAPPGRVQHVIEGGRVVPRVKGRDEGRELGAGVGRWEMGIAAWEMGASE